MINELQQLAVALESAGISVKPWHREYGPIANIKSNAPCFRFVIKNGRISDIEEVSEAKGKSIRRFGNNQGSFPAMNLAPLYRISDETQKAEIERLKEEKGAGLDLETIKSWCVDNNWTLKFQKKYRQNFVVQPNRLKELLCGGCAFDPALQLIEECAPYSDPQRLHRELFEIAMAKLVQKTNIKLALTVLFFCPTKKDVREAEDDYGKLSIVMDTSVLEACGYSTVGSKFSRDLNAVLLHVDEKKRNGNQAIAADAFGAPYLPMEEPMPKVKLAAGFDVSLRTMFKGQPCQHRYGRIENATYPIAQSNRQALGAALEWLSGADKKNKTWVSTGKGEAMYIFSSDLSEQLSVLIDLYNGSVNNEQKQSEFEETAKSFAEYLTKTKQFDPVHYPKWIQYFVLRKLDKARTKVVYSYNAVPQEIMERSENWQKSARNLPQFHFGKPRTLFPRAVSGVMNRVWKQDGTLVNEKYKAYSSYFGLELFFGLSSQALSSVLRVLIQNAAPLAQYAGVKFNLHQHLDTNNQLYHLMETLSLIGMLLYWKGYRKDEYMNEYPYLLGQLLKAADGLHELYCKTERNGEIPSQLVGGSMYAISSEFPRQALSQLSQRIMPYLNWANTHKDKRYIIKKENGEESYSVNAGYYLKVFRQLADQLAGGFTEKTRFTDADKAMLFIGYLASFKKTEAASGSFETDPSDPEELKGE